ncbi:MAG: transcriptional activator RfaH [Alphaproteobacteria bacterium]|nr:transcriptional activator RfaH [Alphaproteobacteria bacterium]MDP6516460.1 transcriptional activator RfaH [Alphaproteobacteria bacterium]
MKRWFAVHTKAHREQQALDNLSRQGFEAWLPQYQKNRRHAGRAETVTRPLFPRYLFVAVDITAERWRAILSTYGVAGLIGTADGPLPAPEGVVEALKERADAAGLFTIHRALSFKAGDTIRVAAGPMRDLEGLFEAKTDSERVVILLRLLGRDVRVTVSSIDIEAL